jgi:hypothetical protein
LQEARNTCLVCIFLCENSYAGFQVCSSSTASAAESHLPCCVAQRLQQLLVAELPCLQGRLAACAEPSCLLLATKVLR